MWSIPQITRNSDLNLSPEVIRRRLRILGIEPEAILPARAGKFEYFYKDEAYALAITNWVPRKKKSRIVPGSQRWTAEAKRRAKLPLLLSVRQIAAYLKASRSATYDAIKQLGIPVGHRRGGDLDNIQIECYSLLYLDSIKEQIEEARGR